jgi:putative transposase
VTEEIRGGGHVCSENRVPRFMRAQGGTTDDNHDDPIAPNRLAQRPAPVAPIRFGCKTSPMCRTQQGWLYLVLVLDLRSRKIVGWALADHLRSELVVSALKMAQTALDYKSPIAFETVHEQLTHNNDFRPCPLFRGNFTLVSR